jgi:hypothetical protein
LNTFINPEFTQFLISSWRQIEKYFKVVAMNRKVFQVRCGFLILSFFSFLNLSIAQIQQPVPPASDSIVSKVMTVPVERETPKLKLKPFIVPAALVTYGFISLNNQGLIQLNHSTKNEIKEDHPHFLTSADNYLQFSPAIAVLGLNALGIKGRNTLKDESMIYILSNIISTAFVFPIKKITKEERPDGSNNYSFPSGHTSTAFASAEFLRYEYKDVSPWYGVAGYTAAAATGMLRMYNNKHWFGDVVAGAGFGIASTKLAYLIYPAIKKKIFKKKSINALIMPYYQQKTAGLIMAYHF